VSALPLHLFALLRSKPSRAPARGCVHRWVSAEHCEAPGPPARPCSIPFRRSLALPGTVSPIPVSLLALPATSTLVELQKRTFLTLSDSILLLDHLLSLTLERLGGGRLRSSRSGGRGRGRKGGGRGSELCLWCCDHRNSCACCSLREEGEESERERGRRNGREGMRGGVSLKL
jgi:hypothetical protein